MGKKNGIQVNTEHTGSARKAEKTGKKGRTALILTVAVLAGILFSAPVYAGGPGQFSEMEEAVYRKLQDDTAEWEEIPDLVKYYNPTYRMYAGSAEDTNAVLSEAGDRFAEEMGENLDTIDENLKQIAEQREKLAGLPGSMVIDGQGTTAAQALAQLTATERMLKESRTQLRKGMGQVITPITGSRISTEESLKPVREQITKAVESLFVSYAQLQINRSLVEKQIALYETALETRKTMRAKDMSTDLEVLQAEASLNEAKATLLTVDNGMVQLQTAIGLQLGWSADHPPVIGGVPAPDPDFVSAANREEDYKKALENSRTYEQTGKLSGYSGPAAVTRRDEAVNEANANASAKFDALYAEMQKQKLLYDAAQTSLRRAELAKSQAERLMKLGMLGRAEYEGKQLEYISCEASAKLAALSLTAAISDYQWAVRGLMEY